MRLLMSMLLALSCTQVMAKELSDSELLESLDRAIAQRIESDPAYAACIRRFDRRSSEEDYIGHVISESARLNCADVRTADSVSHDERNAEAFNCEREPEISSNPSGSEQ